MYEELKSFFQSNITLTSKELSLIDELFIDIEIEKGEFFQRSGTICRHIGFIERGLIRHFHYKDGEEQTCDISLEYSWVTDYQSFNQCLPGTINLQAMEQTKLNVINQDSLNELFGSSKKFETFGRMMAQEVADRAIDMAMSLSSEKPEERYFNLLKNQSYLLQRVPQKYLASLIGISPESLSRIRKRTYRDSKS